MQKLQNINDELNYNFDIEEKNEDLIIGGRGFLNIDDVTDS